MGRPRSGPHTVFPWGGRYINNVDVVVVVPGGRDPPGTINSSMTPARPTHDVEKETLKQMFWEENKKSRNERCNKKPRKASFVLKNN